MVESTTALNLRLEWRCFRLCTACFAGWLPTEKTPMPAPENFPLDGTAFQKLLVTMTVSQKITLQGL